MRRIVFLLAFLLGLGGCASTALLPVTAGNFAPEQDEQRLWQRAREEQARLDESGLLLQDRDLDAYLDEVARRLQPPEVWRHVPFRIKVVKNPFSNAFAYPNGVIYVHTGILARMENEAQLATLLAHEMTHATHRHQVREFRGQRNRTAALASLRATLGGLPAIGELTTALGELGTMASVSGYARDMETEADMEGIARVVAAGYDPREAPKLFDHIKQELQEEGEKEPFFFGSHPRLKERAGNYRDFLEEHPGAGGTVGAETFARRVTPALLANARLQLQAGRYEKAAAEAEKYLAARPKDPRGYFLLGEVLRQQGGEEELSEAAGYFKKALAADPAYPEPHRSLGLLQLKAGRKKEAKKAFQSYLKLAPGASDSSYIEDYIAQCR
jgi:predicted Zn-dependent protease